MGENGENRERRGDSGIERDIEIFNYEWEEDWR